MDDIYSSRILAFAGNIPRIGRLEDADASADAHSKLCGSRLTVYLKMRDGVVTDFAQEVKACALGQAAASIVASHVVGATAAELTAARAAMQAMLTADGEGPDGRFEELRFLKPVKDYKARHASTMLALEATCKAADAIMARARSAGT